MKKLPLGIQTFSKVIKDNYRYVDKTKEIYHLLESGSQYYFLSRPRRFGKSLLISTLKEIFSGSKELFKNLWIYDKVDWQKYPVIHFDFSGLEYGSREELKNTLEFLVNQNARNYDVELKEKGYDKRFIELIGELSKINKVVILVDEYDKPIIDFIDKKEIAAGNRDILRTFYSVIKRADQFLRFALITGVSKFSRVSVFSGLNNLNDITVDDRFAAILGYTEEELQRCFKDEINDLAARLRKNKAEMAKTIKKWYNGYSWDGKSFMYNPLSILMLFSKKQFDNYWFSTGTPTFLVKLLKERNYDISEFEDLPVSSYIFDSYDVDNIEIAPLLFQTGYLTIKEAWTRKEKKWYRLSYPNKEVRESFLTYLFREYTGRDLAAGTRLLERMAEAVEAGDMESFIQQVKSLFASIPYNIFIGDREAYYHSIIYLILRLCGVRVEPEKQTNTGRIDAVIETGQKVYIIEFKIGSEQEALDQIKNKNYHESYLSSDKEIVLMGVGFDLEKRNIGNYALESVPPHHVGRV
ncbi:MAG: AAA family ATPase [Candidatus Aminicenantes bacterium]|nr:AAA family ATPase [Candidatus Aminicenantes bacterium]